MTRVTKALLLGFILSALFGTAAQANTVMATSCSTSAVQSAINSSSNGDTVQVPGGSATWSATVTISNSHQITLNGGGCSVTWGGGYLVITAGTANNTIITNFTMTGSYTNGDAPISITTSNSPVTQVFRVNGNTFIGGNPGAPASFINEVGNGPGLIDHNSFTTTQGADEMLHFDGSGAGNDAGWRDVVTPGGPNMMFVEDNTFTCNSSTLCSAIQSYYGARTVFRHNTLINSQIDQHGTGGAIGARWWEVYNNDFSNDYGICIRAGSGVIFSNINTPQVLMVEEDSGYPALYQVGQGQLQGGNPTSCATGGLPGCEPAFVWSNPGMQINLNQTGCANPSPNMVQFNRDVYVDGGHGLTTGTLANRPGTCSTFQAYFATDQNTLYKCTATNSWTAYYTPYPYPYPLTQGDPPSPPSNLQATPQ